MMFRKLRTAPAAAFALMSGFALAFQAFPAASEDQQQPPADAAQPATDAAAPAAQPAQDGTSAAPAAEAPAEPAQGAAPAPSDGAATAPSPDAGAAAQPQGAAAEPAAPAAPAEGGAATAINASQVQIGAAVFGSDGAKIGEINGVKSDDTGKVQQILVTDGVPASMNAKVFEVSADKIASVADGVKLSLSSEEAKKLPIIDKSKG